MRHSRIIELIGNLKLKYGDSYVPYGTSDFEEEGTGFRIAGIEATFSVMCLSEMPMKMYDIQIESYPPGYYLYNGTTDLTGFLSLIDKYKGTLEAWPINQLA